ncbi:unnamed protein product [Blepharisma stoltei]|uniref:Uncharacterized protein n=1 Tax=Blepharisma stoltei TaxID=1481888 RepID=A0AAU9IM65_9CILI|nr:unnamed protein product [Blepharisma stoltei]
MANAVSFSIKQFSNYCSSESTTLSLFVDAYVTHKKSLICYRRHHHSCTFIELCMVGLCWGSSNTKKWSSVLIVSPSLSHLLIARAINTFASKIRLKREEYNRLFLIIIH